jgi:hypothetical protein
MDTNPGDPKTCGSGIGFGFATLLETVSTLQFILAYRVGVKVVLYITLLSPHCTTKYKKTIAYAVVGISSIVQPPAG